MSEFPNPQTLPSNSETGTPLYVEYVHYCVMILDAQGNTIATQCKMLGHTINGLILGLTGGQDFVYLPARVWSPGGADRVVRASLIGSVVVASHHDEKIKPAAVVRPVL